MLKENGASNVSLGTEREMAADIAFQRSKVYKLFSSLFSFPERELFEFLKSGGLLNEIRKAFRIIPPAPPFIKERRKGSILDHLGRATEKFSSLNLKDLQEGYAGIFETPGKRCALYEANYLDFPQEEMADIAGFYNAFGFKFEERPDHLGAELEFLHLLTMKEAKAVFSGEEKRVELCMDGERKFLSTHPGRWVEAMAENIKEREGLPYFRFASALAGWLRAEAQYLGLTLETVKASRMREMFHDGFVACDS
ncbi:MAG: molecular chaperone TorD family protein [Thermodesulfobacteriota bacterium]|nr:molecular chaperone TorD family protein [Thermodesulfobacteriota bacterium]